MTSQGLTLGVRRAGTGYSFEGVLTRARGGVPVTLAQIVDGRLQDLAGGVTEVNGRYIITTEPPPGTYRFTAPTADARSHNYGLVVPTATPGTSWSHVARRTSHVARRTSHVARGFSTMLLLAFVRNDRRLVVAYATPAAAAGLCADEEQGPWLEMGGLRRRLSWRRRAASLVLQVRHPRAARRQREAAVAARAGCCEAPCPLR